MTRSQRNFWNLLILLPLTAVLAGCPNNARQDDADPAGPAQATAEQRAQVRERLAAAEGTLVGDVEAANDTFAMVGGIDPKLINKQSMFHFRDPIDGAVIASGRMENETAGGRIAVRIIPGDRVPRAGDLAAVQKAAN